MIRIKKDPARGTPPALDRTLNGVNNKATELKTVPTFNALSL